MLITGGCGFIAKNFIRFLRSERPGWRLVNVDALTYAGTVAGLPDESPTFHMVRGDIRDKSVVLDAISGCDALIHFAAETHVDRSIASSAEFVSTNVMGLQVLLDAAMHVGVPVFTHISTDEVYGSLAEHDEPWAESAPLAPRSPYAASKAAQDHLLLSYFHTHGMDVRLTRCTNNYGPFQFPEKLVPLTITNALRSKSIPLYGDGLQRRDWIHVEDHCSAILRVLEVGRAGEIYNIGTGVERRNRDVVKSILGLLGLDEHLITYIPDRPGHDRRYALDSSKARHELGWSPSRSFESGLEDTVKWYRQSENWWAPILAGKYQEYYDAQYRHR